MLFATLLKSIVQRGSMALIDGAGRCHQIGDNSAPRPTVRLTRRHSGSRAGAEAAAHRRQAAAGPSGAAGARHRVRLALFLARHGAPEVTASP